MESAVDALKIAFAVFVFLIGITVLFTMTSRASETARILITEIDKTSYYNYYTDVDEQTIDANGNRIVTIQDIIPSLYRYSEENYGVTIVNKSGDIIARFDLDTETACNNWLSSSDYNKETFIKETDKTLAKVNNLANRIGARTVNTIDNKDKLETLFRKLYRQVTSSTIRREYYCYWIGNMGWTAQRIDSDLSRNRCRI